MMKIFKIILREDLAIEDDNNVGFEYEIRDIPNNSKYVNVCFQNEKGRWVKMRYERKTVEQFIEQGRWIKV